MTIIEAKKRIDDALIPLGYSSVFRWDSKLETQLVNRYAEEYAGGMDFAITPPLE